MSILLIDALVAAVVVSMVSLIGVFTIANTRLSPERITPYFLSLAAGAMIGNALLHLIPEAYEHIIDHPELGIGLHIIAAMVIGGFFTFFAIDLFLHSVGKHDAHAIKPIGFMVLVGDALENFMDGIVIGSAFMLSPAAGIATTLAVIVHEIPIELGDFAVLIHSGLNKKKALLYNFLSGLVSLVGVLLAFFFGEHVANFPFYMGPIAAGAFIYMVGSSLVPAIRANQSSFSSGFVHLLIALGGTGIMTALLLLDHAH